MNFLCVSWLLRSGIRCLNSVVSKQRFVKSALPLRLRAKGDSHLRNCDVPRLHQWTIDPGPKNHKWVASADSCHPWVQPNMIIPCLLLLEHPLQDGVGVRDDAPVSSLSAGQDVASGHLQLPGKGEKLQHPGDGLSMPGICWMQARPRFF